MRSVVVTGGAGAIGAAVLSRFRAQGDAALGIDQRAHEGVVSCDVTDEAAVAAAFAEVRERQGPVEVLVHSAGITGRGSVTDEDPATWRRILEVNLTSAYLCCREVIPDMQLVGRGRIVLIASVNGRFGGSAALGPRVCRVERWVADTGAVPGPGARRGRRHYERGGARASRNADVGCARRRPPARHPRDDPGWPRTGGTRGPGRHHRAPLLRGSPVHQRRHDRRQRRPMDGLRSRSKRSGERRRGRTWAAQCAAGCAKHRLSSEASRSRSKRSGERRRGRTGRRSATRCAKTDCRAKRAGADRSAAESGDEGPATRIVAR